MAEGRGGGLGAPDAVARLARPVRHNSEGHLHCQVEVYFSPAAAFLAKEIDADPCNKPSIDGLDLLIGPEDSWAVLFPEYRV